MAKLVVGENDLKTWCENNNKDDLLSEWDYTSNRGLKINLDGMFRFLVLLRLIQILQWGGYVTKAINMKQL